MADNGATRLEYIADTKDFPMVDPSNDKYLVYLGEALGTPVSRAASVGRVLTKPLPDGTLAFGTFQFHKPSENARKILDAVGTPEISQAPVLAYVKGRFYMMEKSTACELCGALEETV